MTFREENDKERMKFVDKWSDYVMHHDDKAWSRQQNIIINSCMKTANIAKKDYFIMIGGKDRNQK